MFRFTIRELVLVTLVVAMGFGWWIEHRQLAATQQKLLNAAVGEQMYEEALNQTNLALYELGIRWGSRNGTVVLRPTTPSDNRPTKRIQSDLPLKPNFDINQFAGSRISDATSQKESLEQN